MEAPAAAAAGQAQGRRLKHFDDDVVGVGGDVGVVVGGKVALDEG